MSYAGLKEKALKRKKRGNKREDSKRTFRRALRPEQRELTPWTGRHMHIYVYIHFFLLLGKRKNFLKKGKAIGATFRSQSVSFVTASFPRDAAENKKKRQIKMKNFFLCSPIILYCVISLLYRKISSNLGKKRRKEKKIIEK